MLRYTKAEVYGFEFSKDSAQFVNKKLSAYSKFHNVESQKIPMEHPDNFFDIITCLEVAEHCDDTALEKLKSECLRLLKPGGYLIVTVPNEEDLNDSSVCCPDCGCKFHTVQHIKSFSSESIVNAFGDGFSLIKVSATRFAEKGFRMKIMSFLLNANSFIYKRKKPHLICILKKA
ncbi:MAG: class I SAM-dependent methyltransferase [Oscillospiraceae bacterium]|nr:class I SAM-dependent methyltransferase [Oscillospiraceae bacterium]